LLVQAIQAKPFFEGITNREWLLRFPDFQPGGRAIGVRFRFDLSPVRLAQTTLSARPATTPGKDGRSTGVRQR
jgi:hypothetical protein